MKYIYLLLAWCIYVCGYSQPQPLPNNCMLLVDGKFYNPLTNSVFISKGVNFGLALYSEDGGNTFEIKPSRNYYAGDSITCVGQTGCDTDINTFMQEMKTNLGINTLRIPVFEAFISDTNFCSSGLFDLAFLDNSPINGNGHIQLTDLAPLTVHYTHILDLAQSNGLKVVLLLSAQGSECMNGNIKTKYDEYYTATAFACKAHPALLAYDLWNEPDLQHKRGIGLNKTKVCQRTNEIYDIVKATDPNHLITMGIWSPDALLYSPEVVKADFFAYHIYTTRETITHEEPLLDRYGMPVLAANGDTVMIVVLDQNLDYHDLPHYIESYNTYLTWLKNNCNRPFMIGETGFRARRANPADMRMDGDLTDQANYLQQTFQSTINAGGLGYIWWQGYDATWEPPGDPGQTDFGLMDPDFASDSTILKPAATTLKNFDQYHITNTPVAYPGNYTNLGGYLGTVIHGNVINDLSEPVKDAIVNGWQIRPSIKIQGNVDYTNYSQTFSLPDGSFALTSKTPLIVNGIPEPLSTTRINRFEISAVFHNSTFCDGYNKPAGICEGQSFALAKQQLTDVSVANPLHSADHNVYAASNNLYFNNVLLGLIVSNGLGGTPENKFTAGREIAITGNCMIDPLGYEAQFYIEQNTPCNDFAYNHRLANAPQGNGPNKQINRDKEESYDAGEKNSKTIYLNYDNTVMDNTITVYPNPVTNSSGLSIYSQAGISSLALYNSMMQQVFYRELNSENKKNVVYLNNLNTGLYTLQITLPNGNKSMHQLIIQ